MTQQKMKARVIKAEAPSQTTKQMYDDPFIDIYENGDILQPPYNLKELKGIGEYSTILQQCIEAYKINILGFGFEPRYLFDYNAQDTSSERKKKADEEWTQLTEFMRYLHFDEEAETVLGYALEDREKMGNGYVEVLRDGTNKPAGIEFADGQYMRVCKKTVPDLVPYTIVRDGKTSVIQRWRSFRRYVQMINGKKVYFKEYGDTRIMDSRTGKFDDNTPDNLRATEIIHFKIGSGAYGVPRWIGHIVNIYGTRKAQELNYLYFKQGRHVPAAIVVENGMLSADSEAELQKYMNGLEGSDNALGYPTALGTVVTFKHNQNRAFQFFTEKGGLVYYRTADGAATNQWNQFIALETVPGAQAKADAKLRTTQDWRTLFPLRRT
ncbi:phage portal protein [Terribacillus saccharophilus]|nr:phage portal protein [Terribacillus saccharophilus]